MLLAVPLMLLAGAAPAPADVGGNRKVYSECLAKLIQPSLDQKLSLVDFQTAMKTKCASQEAAFRNAILAADKADKMSAADAQKDADDQVSEYTDKFIGEYEDYLKPA